MRWHGRRVSRLLLLQWGSVCCIGCLVWLRSWHVRLRLGVVLLLVVYRSLGRRLLNGLLRVLVLRYRLMRCLVGRRNCLRRILLLICLLRRRNCLWWVLLLIRLVRRRNWLRWMLLLLRCLMRRRNRLRRILLLRLRCLLRQWNSLCWVMIRFRLRWRWLLLLLSRILI